LTLVGFGGLLRSLLASEYELGVDTLMTRISAASLTTIIASVMFCADGMLNREADSRYAILWNV